MSLQSILTSIITFSIIYLIHLHTKRKSSQIKFSLDNKKVLLSNIVFFILGFVLFLLCLFSIGLGFYFGWENKDSDHDSWLDYIWITVFLLIIAYTSLYCFLYYFNHKVIFDENDFSVYDVWNNCKTMPWNNIKDIEFNSIMKEYNIISNDGTKVKISNIIYGLDEFKRQLIQHDPYLSHRLYN